MNDYDASRIADLLNQSHGFKQVSTPDQADLILLNTCHIREKAEEKLFSELGRLHKIVKNKKSTLFAVGGCVAQATGEEIFRRAPFVQLVFGPQTYHRLPLMLDRLQREGGPLMDADSPTDSKFDQLPENRSTGSIASITVQEGCDKFCAFCVVPFTRGREWSRPVEAILNEVTSLVRQGVIEIQLLGQNVNAYQGEDQEGVPHDLALLMRRVALVSGVERIRFVTSHPADMTDDLVTVFGDLEQLCSYFHLPIQSGSDAVLERMGRGHTVDEYLTWVDRLKSISPNIALASDFIVGFPGESDADFQKTLDLVSQVGFDHAYSFCFSARPGTKASEMSGQVSMDVGSRRLATLQEAINTQQFRRNQEQVGRVESVLVEGVSKKDHHEMSGRTPGYRKVNFPGDPLLIGRVVSVEIIGARPNSLKGVLVQ